MIRFVVTAAHRYTVDALDADFGAPLPACDTVTYEELFAGRAHPAATYIFGDIERLASRELALAAQVFRQMRALPGFRVLNDPARVRTRYGLLRALRAAGLNDFDAYPADGCPRPSRFPVFVRIAATHEPALTGLLPDQAALNEALERLQAEGHPLARLLVIEYAAEPVAPGLFRRWGAYRIGGRIHLDHVVTEDTWNVKWGRPGLVGDETYRADDADIRSNRFEDHLIRVFDLAGIDYGRADFGLVGGRPQIYEINTNPTIGRLAEHPSAIRMATMRFAHERLATCLTAIDSPPAPVRFSLDPAALPANAVVAYDEINALRDHQRGALTRPIGLRLPAVVKQALGRMIGRQGDQV
ncbi:hypothetical protein [Phreatobacter oligotrophus]|uniref:hypothetical protein n=1 Tax=Phreatobacter oligotrophus TaxID=1122261 RepID=UPI002357CCB2|nr:hypothetical protein [Phreatobacter oligotrophus]MBX9990385.1 hypothetical protein [Phreatobacter oligotrophus]